MKKKTYSISALLLVSFAMIVFHSCSDMEKDFDAKLVKYPEITLADFSPKAGYPGIHVTITGTNFGEYSDAAKVYFNGVSVTEFVSYADSQMVVEVPEDAGVGPITVQVWTNNKGFDSDFAYKAGANITSFNTERSQAGDTVTISGNNFGTDASVVSVYIGETQAEIISVTDSEIQFKVPDTESGKVTVNIDGQTLEGITLLIGDELITGSLIGHEGSWGNNSATTISAAVDGDLSTYVDASGSTGYVGYDFGSGNAAQVSLVRYAPRAEYAERMVGGEIRGANDPTLYDYVTLHTITDEPTEGEYTEVSIETEETYRYIYYYSSSGNCNLSEIEFYGNVVDADIPEGKYVFEFDDAEDETWVPQQDASYVIEDNLMKVTFNASQFEGTNKRRADLKFMDTPWIYTSDYPIVAIKFTKPATVNFRPDITGLDSGFSNNDYQSDFEDQDVYYWDLSEKTTSSRVECGVFQFKIPDITSDETGYEVDWIRTFESVNELSSFLDQ